MSTARANLLRALCGALLAAAFTACAPGAAEPPDAHGPDGALGELPAPPDLTSGDAPGPADAATPDSAAPDTPAAPEFARADAPDGARGGPDAVADGAPGVDGADDARGADGTGRTADADAGAAPDAGAPPACDFAAPDHTVGLTLCRDGTSAGYVLFPAKHRADVYLIDRLGRVVNHWAQSRHEPGQSCYLRPNGNLVRAAMLKGAGSIGGGEGGRIEEYDWDDELVWAFDYASDDHMTHHDFTILPSGNLLLLAVERKTAEQAAAVGFLANELRDGYLAPESLIEVARTADGGFEIVWQWHVWDHLVQERNPALANYGRVNEHPERLQVSGNAAAFWNHANSVRYHPERDQIVVSARTHNELWVIDHSTTSAEAAGHEGGRYGKGGDFLYRWGNPQTYGAGTSAERRLFNQHDAQWIAPGLPGAGNLLVFNNGLDRPGAAGFYSSIDELTPPVGADGSYPTLAPGVAWGPTTLTWQYVAEPPSAFYSSEISGVQRLPNGNTLVCEGVTGRFFEVTAAGEQVWEYVNPVANAGPLAQYERAMLDPKGHPENAVFKIHWYGPDFEGFAGRTLTPGDVIEDADAACPTDNDNYRCLTAATCAAEGGADESAHFTCGNGNVCCFALVQASQPPQP